MAHLRDPDALADFSAQPFSHDGQSRPVYRRGAGPGVILIHEMPGITPECARLARRLGDAGFTVVMPSLFGTPGRPFTTGYVTAQLAKGCVAGEFAAFAARKSGPVTLWLRALARALHTELGGPGVGVIGMCFTGNFALAMMADDSVIAPVTCQPALPIAGGAAALHLSDEDLVVLRRRAAAGVPLLGVRFTHDKICSRARFATLAAELGERFLVHEIDSSPGNPHGHRRGAHSTLTLDLIDEDGSPTRAALDRVIAFLRSRLS